MTEVLDVRLLSEASGLVAERLGLHFPEERWPDLAHGLEAAREELGFERPEDFLRWLRSDESSGRRIEVLASRLTVGETYFFRDPASFEALERSVLPPLIAARAETGRNLRLWSAGCCTGEEAYSLAISCARCLPDRKAWNVSILATDIDPKFLAKAEAGLYGEWSFRGSPDWLREGFFGEGPDKKLAIDPGTKSLVRFEYLNLAVDVYPSLSTGTNAMDVIFCRNVLMYFTPKHQRRVAASLSRCLATGGYLLVGPAEASASLLSTLEPLERGGVTFFRKAADRPCFRAVEEIAMPDLVAAPDHPSTPPLSAVIEATPPLGAPSPIDTPPREDTLALARARADRGDLEGALAACKIAIGMDRGDAVARFLYASVCYELGRYEEAIASMGKVLYLDRDFILAHHALGSLYRRIGRTRESGRHFAIVLKILSVKERGEIVPESGGMTCGRLMESVLAMVEA